MTILLKIVPFIRLKIDRDINLGFTWLTFKEYNILIKTTISNTDWCDNWKNLLITALLANNSLQEYIE